MIRHRAMTLVAMVFMASAVSAEGPYLDYGTFRTLAALAPEAANPRVLNLTEDGQHLWAQGQLRLPAAGDFVEGNFKGDRTAIGALVFQSGSKRYLLIAQRTKDRWIRQALLELNKESGVAWNGKALQLGEDSFVAWDGHHFRMDRGPLAVYLHAYAEEGFQRVLLKITYIREQAEPVDGWLLSTYYGHVDLAVFKRYRRKDVSYGNDDSLGFRFVTLSPARLRDVVTALRDFVWAHPASGTPHGSYSVSVVDAIARQGFNFFEVLMTAEELQAFLKQAAQKIEPDDPASTKVLREVP